MGRRTPAGDAFTDLVLEIFRLNGRLLATGDRMTRPVGQTSARWQVLGAIDQQALTVAGIARAMGLARQSVQRTVDLLESEGLVESVDNPAHRRAKLIQLTPRGRTLLAAISRRQVQWANRLGALLGSKEIQRALSVVRRLREELEKELRIREAE
jgi:DNA-binding MarR family transcriptional regulator